MMTNQSDGELFDDTLVLALAQSVDRSDRLPGAAVRPALLARLRSSSLPAGFSVRMASDDDWLAHAVPGIRMKVLAVNPATGYATLVLDVAPGTRFPSHHHSGTEECYVLSGSLHTCDRRLGPGDFVHADAGTEHAELWTEAGCRVLLVASADEHLGHLSQ